MKTILPVVDGIRNVTYTAQDVEGKISIYRWEAWTLAVLGLWGIVAPFILKTASLNMWNDIIVGALVAVVGFLLSSKRSWQGWLALAAGAWCYPGFIPALRTGQGNLWNDIIVGLVVAAAGLLSLGGNTVDTMQ